MPPEYTPPADESTEDARTDEEVGPIATALSRALKDSDPNALSKFMLTKEDLQREIDVWVYREEVHFLDEKHVYSKNLRARFKMAGGMERVASSARSTVSKALANYIGEEPNIKWDKIAMIEISPKSQIEPLSSPHSILEGERRRAVLRVKGEGTTWDIDFEVQSIGKRVVIAPVHDWLHSPLAVSGPATRGARFVFGVGAVKGQEAAATTKRVLDQLRHRLEQSLIRGVRVESPEPGVIHVNCVRRFKDAESLKLLLAMRGELQFQIEVLPVEVLESRRYGDDRAPRLDAGDAPWKGAGDAFPATKAGFDGTKRERSNAGSLLKRTIPLMCLAILATAWCEGRAYGIGTQRTIACWKSRRIKTRPSERIFCRKTLWWRSRLTPRIQESPSFMK